MRNAMNPYGGTGPLIDKMIGNAYDIVKYVAKYLKEIRYVAENMQYVYQAANGNRLIFGANASSDQLVLALPTGFDQEDIDSISVLATNSTNVLVPPTPTSFSYSVSGNNVVINITSGSLYTAYFKCVITHSLPNE